MIVDVTLKDLSLAGRYPEASNLGITRWRYFYTDDCTEGSSRVPVKNGFEDMPGWSNGWLTCPVEHGGRSRRIIHNEVMDPLYWIANIFIQELQPVEPINQKESSLVRHTSNSDNRLNVARLARDITVRIDGPGPSGSGTIIGKTAAAYQIATAWHVLSDVAKGETIRIIFANGEVAIVPISRFTRIRDTDLAVIRVDFTSPSPSVTSVPTSAINPADRITVSGWSLATRDNPVLYRHLPGTIVSINTAPSSDGYSILYTTSSPTLEGMSGGPVINDRGFLVGIHGRAERLPTTDVEGVKDVATTNGQALPVTLIINDK
jgi:S1-C subfamily serine protease